MRLSLLIASALLPVAALATPALAAEPASPSGQTASPAPATAAPAAPAKEKKQCRSVQVTGSLFTKSSCHTAEEWHAIDDQNALVAGRMANEHAVGGTGRTN